MTDVLSSTPGMSSRMDSINPDVDLPDELDYGDDAPDALKNKVDYSYPVVDILLHDRLFIQSPPATF